MEPSGQRKSASLSNSKLTKKKKNHIPKQLPKINITLLQKGFPLLLFFPVLYKRESDHHLFNHFYQDAYNNRYLYKRELSYTIG